MDEKASLDPSLLPALFELGVMGIEIPEQYGGSGASFFSAILAVEALARIDPSVSVLVDVQNTLVINALLRWANDDLRSLNAQIEFVLRKVLKQEGRLERSPRDKPGRS
jgi:hypothetical protein